MKINMNKQQLIGLNPNSRLIKDYKFSLISLSNIQLETSIGLMLGDASLQTKIKVKLNGVIIINLI